MTTPISVQNQFSDSQKDDIRNRWLNKETQKQIAEHYGVPRRTIMKLCKYLGLQRSPKEASTTKSILDKTETINKIKELRDTHSLDEIVEIVGGSPSAVNRLCNKHSIILNREAYGVAQAERMKSAWTPEKREAISGSKYAELNDPIWIKEHYIDKKMSMADISKMINAPLMSISYYITKHGIKKRSKDEYLRYNRRKAANKQKIITKWGTFVVQSNAEKEFLEFLETTEAKNVECEPITLESNGSQYIPDFKVDGDIIEVKPPEYAIEPGINRQKFARQWIIAKSNNVDIKLWYRKKGFYDPKPIEDIDRYFALNWKLIFKNPDECCDFLLNYGFVEPQWAKDKLLIGLNNVHKIKEGNELNANYQNNTVIDFIKHWNSHYWRSKYKGYNTIDMAFKPGNTTILRDSMQFLWSKKNNINIYGLIKSISRHFKDFYQVGIFKPWVARYVYEKFLPNGGIIVDPCMGWGGRLLGTLDGPYEYVGFDLNKNAIDTHCRMSKFIGSRFITKPTFTHADSSYIKWPKGDLLFTSPPHDDTESYFGLDKQCIDTSKIYDNIMKFEGVVALNIPLRHRDMCMDISCQHNRKLVEELKMKTSSIIREKAYEPILIFDRIL